MGDPETIQTGPVERNGRFLTFYVGEQLYALPAHEVSEVIRIPPVARVPQGPASLLGLGNLRGAVLPIASARGLLGKENAPPTRAIVLAGRAPVALAVDSVDALVAPEAGNVQADQAQLAGDEGERLRDVFRVPGREGAVKVLDIWPMLESAFVPAARPVHRTGAVSSPSMAAPGLAAVAFRRLVTFEVAGQEFALPLDEVQEVIQLPANVMAVPRSESLVLGVAAYRDALLPLLSVRGLLGLAPAAAADGREKVLVVRVGAALAGLVADCVRAIVTADPALIEPTPPMLTARIGGESRITAIYRGEGGRRLISILSKDQLFHEDVMQRLRQSGAATSVPAPVDEVRSGELQFLVFRLGEDEFALPIEAVEEVARAPLQVTRVPKTPKFLEGVINLRGEVLAVVDQRRRFDMPPAPDQEARRLIVVRTEHHRAGLIVDSVSEVLRSAPEAVEPAPDLTGEAHRLVRGVISFEQAGRLILLLDPAELLTRAERGLLDAFQANAGQAAS